MEKQLARYVLMSDTIKEEFEQDEAVKAAKLGLEYDQTQAEFKEKQDQLMAKLEEAYQQFVQQGKNSAEQALSDLTQRRKGELSRLDSEAEAEMAQIMMGTEKYEDACRTRYSVEVERQNERLNKARSEAMLGESEQLEDVSNQQQERAQMLGSVRSEAQAVVNGKYERVLAELSENWQKESEERDQKFILKARSYWESHSQAVERQLDVTQQTLAHMYDADLLRWKEELLKLKNQEGDRKGVIEAMEQDNYEQEAHVLQETLAHRKQVALNELAEAGANITDIDTESEAQMEHTFAKGLEMEKAKYEELWKKTWAPIEENVAVLRELYATETDEQNLMQEEAILKLLSVHEAGLNARSPSSPAFSKSDGSAKARFNEVFKALSKVWRALEVSPAETTEFLDKAAEAAPQTQSLQTIYEEEAVKLADRLAIRKILNEREKMLEKLLDTRSAPGDDTRRNFLEGKLKGEIQQMDASLRQLIPLYEHNHRERFMFQGKSYLEKVEADEVAYL